jgi:hypothetical protein
MRQLELGHDRVKFEDLNEGGRYRMDSFEIVVRSFLFVYLIK